MAEFLTSNAWGWRLARTIVQGEMRKSDCPFFSLCSGDDVSAY